MESSGPLREFGVTALHDRAGHDGEVLAAGRGGATVSAKLLGGVMLFATAFRADRAIWPTGSFKPLAGGFFIVEMGLGELVLGHLKTSLMAKHYPLRLVVSTTYFTL